MLSKCKKLTGRLMLILILLVATIVPQNVMAASSYWNASSTTESTQELLFQDWIDLEIQFNGKDTNKSVTQSINLPTQGSRGSKITWKSNNTEVVSVKGVVVRPTEAEGDKYITLTATLSLRGLTQRKEFYLRVIKNTEATYELITGPQRTLYYFNQLDDSYSSYPYGELSLGSDGSGPTALAMVVSSLTNEVYDPVYMANWSVKKSYYDIISGSLPTLIPAGASAHGLTVENVNPYYNNETAVKKITQGLQDGKLVIALVTWVDDPSFDQSWDKYIVLRGITEKGKILVADPADDRWRSRTKKTAGYDLQTIIDESRITTSGTGPFWIISNQEQLPKVSGMSNLYTQLAGKKLVLTGNVTSQSELSNVSVTISSLANGWVFKEVLKAQAEPDSKNYALKNIGLDTSGLKAGSYKIRVYATTVSTYNTTNPIYEADLTVTSNEQEKVSKDKEVLSIRYTGNDTWKRITKRVVLPLFGEYGSDITWSSSHPSIITAEGKISRPKKDTKVTLTATIDWQGVKETKEFTVTVKGK